MLSAEVANKKDDKWLVGRTQSKAIRIDTTDVIKDFVDYATSQGSKSAKFYYKHVTNATYKALGFLAQRKPKLRDTLNICELSQLSTAEQMVQLAFEKHMADEIPYKVIYRMVVEDLEGLSDSLFLRHRAENKRLS